ncbi:ead/Ea22-like family protein [Enterobacter hormaechei]|uniref:ead/Ea22-like family protein n=1 Tax=Enterobacter hormaechei TaxID=158836 RepID=UPI002963CAC9|nr:ead/Ea22-like family protein [Enterobacter hormaechei]MDW2599909.1 ead/Ea22-like family protein [Enterobacter hormaechei]
MSNIDKRALREAAERAGQNDWEYVYTSDLSAPGRGYITVGGAEAIYCLNKAAGGVKQSENVLRYIAAASPSTVLALLDELEAKDKRIAELEAKLDSADKLQDSAFRHGLQHGFSLGQTDNQAGFEECLSAYGTGKGE